MKTALLHSKPSTGVNGEKKCTDRFLTFTVLSWSNRQCCRFHFGNRGRNYTVYSIFNLILLLLVQLCFLFLWRCVCLVDGFLFQQISYSLSLHFCTQKGTGNKNSVVSSIQNSTIIWRSIPLCHRSFLVASNSNFNLQKPSNNLENCWLYNKF